MLEPCLVKCFNCDNLMRKYSGEPVHERLFETEAYACKVKDLTLSYGEIRRERQCDLFKESKRWLKIRRLVDFAPQKRGKVRV